MTATQTHKLTRANLDCNDVTTSSTDADVLLELSLYGIRWRQKTAFYFL